MIASSVNCMGQSWYWLGFTDKAGSGYSINEPESFLSEKSIHRRLKQNIPIDETDLPVSRVYVDSILNSGATLLYSTRWLNGITVQATHDSLFYKWRNLGFIREIQLTKPFNYPKKSASVKFDNAFDFAPIDTSVYGASAQQVGMLNGHLLHRDGFKGQGMVIAVLDGGFKKANEMISLRHLYENGKILGTKDFVNPSADFYAQHEHGMNVLSVMGGNIAGQIIGTAPEASYWLIRTEDVDSEFIIEEDNWIAGAEYADSVGADIINSSLGYSQYDYITMSHTYARMDGKTTRVTRGANMAAQKGMLVFNSAGNEGMRPWKYITAPSDGDDVIAVGAVDKSRQPAGFSSRGPSSDGDVKPDLAAQGVAVAVQGTDSTIITKSGTSFASPLLAGMAACLWQANPDISAREIARVMRISGHLSARPDTLLGYGIPDMFLTHTLLNQFFTPGTSLEKKWKVFPNPFHSDLYIRTDSGQSEEVDIELLTSSGDLVVRKRIIIESNQPIGLPSGLTKGIYLLKIYNNDSSESHKLVKSK
jgi:serine protease AprX